MFNQAEKVETSNNESDLPEILKDTKKDYFCIDFSLVKWTWKTILTRYQGLFTDSSLLTELNIANIGNKYIFISNNIHLSLSHLAS